MWALVLLAFLIAWWVREWRRQWGRPWREEPPAVGLEDAGVRAEAIVEAEAHRMMRAGEIPHDR